MRFAAFFAEEKLFPAYGMVFKIVARWGGATIGARMAEKNRKSEKMGAKFVRTTSTNYKLAERNLLPQPHVL